MKDLKDYIRTIPDYPKKGIMFRDVTTVLSDADGLKLAIDEMMKLLEGVDFDVIAGCEARGFICGAPLAYNLHKPFVPIRKKGKLPAATVSQAYDLEYGTAEVEIHVDAIKPGQRVVIVDDVVSTGGTLNSIIDAVRSAGASIVDVLVPINKDNGVSNVEPSGVKVKTLFDVTANSEGVDVSLSQDNTNE